MILVIRKTINNHGLHLRSPNTYSPPSPPNFTTPPPLSQYPDPAPQYPEPEPHYSKPAPHYSKPGPQYPNLSPQYSEPAIYQQYEQPPSHNCTVQVKNIWSLFLICSKYLDENWHLICSLFKEHIEGYQLSSVPWVAYS